MKYYDEMQKILSEIDFRQFRPFWYTTNIIKEQNLPIKVYQKADIRKHMHDYFAGYIPYDQMLKEVAKIEKEYNFKFDWTKFPQDYRNLTLTKIVGNHQVRLENHEYAYDNNPNLINVYNKLNSLFNSNLTCKKWDFYVFSKWRQFPSLDPISAYDLICCLISYDMLDNKSEAKEIVKMLDLTEEDYQYFDYGWFMDNVIFGDYNQKVS